MIIASHRKVPRAVLAITVLVVGAGSIWKARDATTFHPRVTLEVLFIGNSFTSFNDLPGTVTAIARSLADQVDQGSSAPGGYTFMKHTTDPTTLSEIKARPWNYVVLQEQSELPALPESLMARETMPYARRLVSLVHEHDPATKVVLFETWGYQDGDANNCPVLPYMCTYASMQEHLREGYAEIARATGATEALVGQAWKAARARYPGIDLYIGDGKHPSVYGTYLAACVFYRTLFGRPPTGASDLSLPDAEAHALQSIAAAQ
jgi:hypothetical protein